MSSRLLNLDQRFQVLPDVPQEDRAALREGAVDRDGDGSLELRRQPDVWCLDALCDALEAVGPAVNAYIAAERRG